MSLRLWKDASVGRRLIEHVDILALWSIRKAVQWHPAVAVWTECGIGWRRSGVNITIEGLRLHVLLSGSGLIGKSTGIKKTLTKLDSAAVIEPQFELGRSFPSALGLAAYFALDEIGAKDRLLDIKISHAKERHRERLENVILVLVDKDNLDKSAKKDLNH